MADKTHPLLQRPLYLYALPTELLDTLVLKADSQIDVADGPPRAEKDAVVPDAAGCSTCNLAGFTDVSQQREHMRTDLHRFNLKRKLAGQKIVYPDEFEQMLDDLNESIDGSDSDESTLSASSQDPLSKLLAKHTINSTTEADAVTHKPRSPLLWLTSSTLPQPTSLGLYRAMFDEEDLREDALALLRYNQLPAAKPPKRTIALIMIGGGHFAAIIVSLLPKIIKDHKGGEERQVDILASKGFHRYTTRRKQGGSQAAHDSGRGNAHSAGAGLRRHNEAALQKEIREMLQSWKDDLAKCELIFIRATGSANRKTLFGYEGAVLKSSDKRIRGFPFTTKRPTKTELLRCFNELTRLKISHVDEAALAKKAKPVPQRPAYTRRPTPPEPTHGLIRRLSDEFERVEEGKIVAHTNALLDLIHRKKFPALTAYLRDNDLSPDFALHPLRNHHTSTTLLHHAAFYGPPSLVLHLLRLGANPGLLNGHGLLPYDIAKDEQTREQFHLARFELGHKAWNWDAAHIKIWASPEEVAKRQRMEKEREALIRSVHEAEMQRIADNALKDAAAKTGRPTGLGIANSDQIGRNTRGLSDGTKVKIERERRARAAEARLAALSSKK